MRISLDNETVVCSLENKNSGFMHEAYWCFNGFLRGKLKIYSSFMETVPECAIEKAEEEIRVLEPLLEYADKYHVEVDSAVRARVERLKRETKEARERKAEEERKEKEEKAKRQKWDTLCRNGCGACPNKRKAADDYICALSGEILPEKAVPKNSGGITYLFNYEAFPSENCPYKI